MRNILGTMVELGLFYFSTKRQALLEKNIALTMPESKKKLVDICRTYWVERHEAFKSLIVLYKPLVLSFEEVVDPN